MKRDLSTETIARMCGVAARTVCKWFDSGKLCGYRIPGKSRPRRVQRKDLIRFLRANDFPLPAELDDSRKLLMVGAVTGLVERLRLSLAGQMGCVSVESAFAAGLLVAELHPDTLVVDLTIGRALAMSMADDLRNNAATANALLIALANEDESEPQALYASGYDEVFQKPFDVELLVASIARAERRRAVA